MPIQHLLQIAAGPAGGVLGDLFRRADGDDLAPAVAALGAEVQQVVGDLDDIQVVLDHNDGVAVLDQLLQHLQQLARILEVQAGRRLVEDVERLAGGPFRQLLRQLDPLGLAAGQGGGGLADLDVAQAHALQRQHLVADRRHGGEEARRLFDRHVQNVGYALALEDDFQRLAIVAFAFADVAGDVDVGQEVHLDLDYAVALAGLAAAALDVEAEAAGAIAARLRFRQARIPVADRSEGAGIGGRVRARGAADRRLVDVDDLVEMLEPLDPVEGGGGVGRIVQTPRGGLVQGLDGEGRLAAARHAGDAGEDADRDLARDVLQVVARGAGDLQHPLAVDGAAAFGRQFDLARPGQVLAGQGFWIGHDFRRRALGADRAAVDAGGRTHVDDVVGRQDRLFVMLDHQHRVAEVAQPLQAVQQAGVVPLVQANGRFVQNIEDAGQARSDLRRQPDALALAARQGAGTARQVQIVEPDVVQEAQPVGDLLQDAPGDLDLLFTQRLFQGREPQEGLGDRQVGDVGDVLAADLDRQSLGLQALAAADLARGFGLIAAQFLAHPGAVGLAPAPLQVWQHALERLGNLVFAGVVVIDELDLVAARAAQDDGLRLLR